MSSVPIQMRRRESAETLLARNLLAARTALGWTQDALSAASGISRATIAQLETGVSDPRLSTLAALAAALGLPVLLLLISDVEVHAVGRLAARPDPPRLDLSDAEVRQLRRWVNSGLLRDRADAVKWAAQRLSAVDGVHPLAVVVAALFTGHAPDPGVTVGAAFGELLADPQQGGAPDAQLP